MTAHNPNLKVPRNFNGQGRPERNWRMTPALLRLLHSPNLAAQLDKAYQQDPALVNEFVVGLRQFRRVLNGDRVRLGETSGDASLPTIAMPFAPREEHHRPDRASGPAYDAYRAAVSQLDATDMTRDLQARMREHDSGSGASTWDRTGPSGTSAQGDNPPSLRESISGAVAALGD